MLNPLVLLKEPLEFNEKLKIYPPTVREAVTNSNFGLYYKLLTMSQDDVKDELKEKINQLERIPTPFEYLLGNAQYIKGYDVLVKRAFYFFCRVKIHFLFEKKQIAIIGANDSEDLTNELNEAFLLSEGDFLDFQNGVRLAYGDKPLAPPEPEDPNEDPRVRAIKARARERDRIKAKQGKKGGISFSTCLVAICCMGIGITPLNIGEMSYASIGEIMSIMQNKEKYDIDIRSLLAGADSKKVKPKYWISNSDKE